MIQGIIKKWFLEEIFLSLYSTVVSKETFWIVTWYFQFSRPTVTLEVDGIKLDLTIYEKVLLYQQKKTNHHHIKLWANTVPLFNKNLVELQAYSSNLVTSSRLLFSSPLFTIFIQNTLNHECSIETHWV